MSKSVFRFKQFNVNQSGSGMKINTDGVLLAAKVRADEASSILDIGTGTGVIALMLAQRYDKAKVHALEINESAAICASLNFNASPYQERMTLYETSFQNFKPHIQYDLIVSNPPFFINSLKNPDLDKRTARHVEEDFFKELFEKTFDWLSEEGTLQVILPLIIKDTAITKGFLTDWHIQHETMIHSFQNSEEIRVIMVLSKKSTGYSKEKFIIYHEKGIYSQDYRACLKPFFINF